MSFLIKDDELYKKYDEIWEKFRDSIKKEFGSEPVYNRKYLKTKIKSAEIFTRITYQKKVLNLFFINNFDRSYF